MIKSILTYWELTQVVKEYIAPSSVEKWMKDHLDDSYDYHHYKTSKDEVLQIYNDDICYTVVGGSSRDKYEWRSNFDWLPLEDKLIHNGFYQMSEEVVKHGSFTERETMMLAGHSRGGACVSVMSYINGWKAIGFGSPKAFRKHVDVDFINVRNPKDPVVHVVPFFKTVGDVRKYSFCRRPHTKYGKHIAEGDTIDG